MTTLHLPGGIVIGVPETPERDEHLIGQLQRVDDFCRRGDTDPGPICLTTRSIAGMTGPLKEAASGLNQRQRRVVADALSKSIREGLE